MAFSVRVFAQSSIDCLRELSPLWVVDPVFIVDVPWWDARELMQDERFEESSFNAGYLDYDAILSTIETRELNQKYAHRVTDGIYKHYQDNLDKLDGWLYEMIDPDTKFRVNVYEW